MSADEWINFPIVLRLSCGSRDELERRANDAGVTTAEFLSEFIDRGFDLREPWDRLEPQARAAYEHGGICREDVNAAVRGERSLPQSESDKRIAANYAEGKRLQALPTTNIHPFDICAFDDDDDEFRFTVKQLMTDEQFCRSEKYWLRQPMERLEAMDRERKAVLSDRTELTQRRRTSSS